MVSPTEQNKFALLVGVDLYLRSTARSLPDGSFASLPDLKGAVNDVGIIRDILEHRFQFQEFFVFTSSPASAHSDFPKEPKASWPTHVSIKKAFNDIHDKAKSGDVLFFHFSGHGALLLKTRSSPVDGHDMDPSLMTADYCCGEPAVRGWELNEWLEKFNKKHVRVIALLDSCYSGGAWRAGQRLRSPDDWVPPPNLPADEAAVQGTQKKPGHRDGDLNLDWGINPRDFTLMAACQRTEQAAERDEDGVPNGAFTLALKKCLQTMPNTSTPTYRVLRDRTNALFAKWEISQKSQVFGRDRLAFLEGYEPFLATPIRGTVKEGKVSLPVGNIHGINKGTEFITIPEIPRVVVSVSQTDDHESEAEIVDGSIEDHEQFIEVIPFRWSASDGLIVILDPSLRYRFQERFVFDVKTRIAGDIRYRDELSPSGSDSDTVWFRLGSNESGGVDIFGPERLIGYKGPVHGWKNTGKSDEQRARDSAVALAHLFRFGQILHLRNRYQDTKPFYVTFNSEGVDNQQKVRCMFQNNQTEELYFAVFILSPGFHVKQLFPPTDTLEAVSSHRLRSFGFSLQVPTEVRRSDVHNLQHRYRDVIRTVVVRGKSSLSLKSIELPNIWNAAQWDDRRSGGSGRDGELSETFDWWIQDDEKFTT